MGGCQGDWKDWTQLLTVGFEGHPKLRHPLVSEVTAGTAELGPAQTPQPSLAATTTTAFHIKHYRQQDRAQHLTIALEFHVWVNHHSYIQCVNITSNNEELGHYMAFICNEEPISHTGEVPFSVLHSLLRLNLHSSILDCNHLCDPHWNFRITSTPFLAPFLLSSDPDNKNEWGQHNIAYACIMLSLPTSVT